MTPPWRLLTKQHSATAGAGVSMLEPSGKTISAEDVPAGCGGGSGDHLVADGAFSGVL